MSNINRDYLIVLNPKTSKVTVPELNYYIYDKYTANLFVNLVTVENGKVVNMVDVDQYKLVLHVLKPTNEIQTVENIQVFNKEKALFQIELDAALTKNIGRYKCELLTIDKTDHIVQSAKFSYRVKKSIYNDLDAVTETPEYPIIITLLDKLQDIDKYEEERRANEVARVAAEKARVKDYTDLRQTVTTDIDTMQQKIDSFDGKVQEVDSAVTQMKTNITDYQTEKNKELDSYKTQKDTQINTAIKGMEDTIDKYKTEKDTEINEKITQQDNKIDSAIQDQNNTIAANNQAQNKVISDAIAEQNKTINTVVENDKVQNDRLTTLENNDEAFEEVMQQLLDTDKEHEERMTAIEAVDVEQNNRLDAIEIKNDQQDGRLNDVEAKNKKQDLDLKCLFAESHSERITLDDEVGNSVFLQNSKQGFATVDELKGNTLVNCNKDVDKELILNGNIDTSGYSTVTTTEGVDGGKVDVALEGNTMVNVCDQEEPVAITKNYEVTTGNHVALQGEYDGKCRPNVYGNTLWIDNDTEEILMAFDGTKNLRLQSSFEDKLITDEKDAHNGKYKVDYKVTGKNKFDKSKTLDGYEINDLATGHIAANLNWFVTDFIPVIPNTIYSISGKANGNAVACYDKNKQFISGISGGLVKITTPSNVRYIKLNGMLEQKDTFQIEEGTTATTYEPYKEYTKTLYLNSPLLEGDTIEQSGNDIVHMHRYGKVVLDGSSNENWVDNASEGDTINGHSIYKRVNIYSNGECMCDKLPVYNSSKEVENLTDFVILYNNKIVVVNVKGASNIGEVKSWLQANPITLISKLATPTREVISTNDNLLLDSYVNGHLDVDSVVPIDKVAFQGNFNKGLRYLYPNTEYTIQFESDNTGKIDKIHLGGINSDILNVVKGVNKYALTTGELSSKSIVINGIGFNMSKIVVTPKVDGEFGYFKGMKSVGECEGNVVEVVAQNKNLYDGGVLAGSIIYGDTKKYNCFTDEVVMTNSPRVRSEYPQAIHPNTEYNITVTNYTGIIHLLFYDKNGNYLNDINFINSSNEGNFTSPLNAYYLHFFTNKDVPLSITNENYKVFLKHGYGSIDFVAPKQNKQTITHEPLRGLPNGIKDKYVIIDGKWYIERNCMAVQFKDLKYSRQDTYSKDEYPDIMGLRLLDTGVRAPIMCDRFAYTNDRIINIGQLITNKENINITGNEFFITIQKAKLKTLDFKGIMNYFTENPMEIIAKATTPIYEPIDYNPFEVYAAITHISNNSNIPCNMVIRNSGFNCMLKPNTTYTVSSNNGLSSVTTKASIGDGILRFYDKDTTSVTKMSNVLVLEGDYITGNPPIPAFFKGMESTFEQELVTDEKDKNYGKYKVNVKATNPDNSQQNNITFYLKEPLRGVGDVKDKVYVKEDKVVVERNCTSYVLEPTQIPSWAPNTKGIYTYNISVNNSIVNTRYGKVVCNSFACDVSNAHIRNYANSISTVVDDSVPNGVIRIITDKDPETLKQYLQANPTTVIYQLATPTYEEVEYFDMKLFVEIFKNTTIIYNSNIPVTSTINYTYSTPLTDAVNTVSDISDEQDSMIIDMATQVATMEMMLM